MRLLLTQFEFCHLLPAEGLHSFIHFGLTDKWYNCSMNFINKDLLYWLATVPKLGLHVNSGLVWPRHGSRLFLLDLLRHQLIADRLIPGIGIRFGIGTPPLQWFTIHVSCIFDFCFDYGRYCKCGDEQENKHSQKAVAD